MINEETIKFEMHVIIHNETKDKLVIEVYDNNVARSIDEARSQIADEYGDKARYHIHNIIKHKRV